MNTQDAIKELDRMIEALETQTEVLRVALEALKREEFRERLYAKGEAA